MTPPERDLPIACNLGAFSAEERARHDALLALLRALVLEMRELPDGYAFRFAPEPAALAEVAEWIGLERRCCPFLRFAIEVSAADGPAWLRLTGDAPVKEFIGGTFLPSTR